MISKQSVLMIFTVCLFSVETLAQAPTPTPLTIQSSLASGQDGSVYIESNVGDVPGRNSILAFKRDRNGKLAAMGEFATGGTGVHPLLISFGNLAGTLGPFDSDQNLIFSRDRTRIFAVNSGSDTVAVFDIRRDGSLDPIQGSPFPSGGAEPVSVGLAGDSNILVVVNKDYDLTRSGFDASRRAPNYSTFFIERNGRLVPIPFSRNSAGSGDTVGVGSTTPTQALVSPSGGLVFDADFFASTIHSLAVRPDGSLEPAASHGTPTSEFVPFPAIANPSARPYVLGLTAHPRQRVLYAGFVFEGRVGVYTYNRSGQFSFARSVAADAGICWLTTNAAGDRVYTSNTLANSISVLDTSDPLHPVNIQNFQLPGPPAGSAQLALDSRGDYLYVVTQQALDFMPPEANALHALRIAPDGRIAAETDRLVIPVAPSAPQGVIAR